MYIWLIRHGQTALNKAALMQGRTDAPLSETGKRQARKARKFTEGVTFDAVYSSPLIRAVETAEIVSGFPREQIMTDERLIEVDFGKYEGKKYYALGPAMTLYWAAPEIFPAPDSVETTDDIRARSTSFLKELETKAYKNVLVASHGGILRGLNGYLLDRRNSLRWRPKMRNCEIMEYSSENGRHSFIGDFRVQAK